MTEGDLFAAMDAMRPPERVPPWRTMKELGHRLGSMKTAERYIAQQMEAGRVERKRMMVEGCSRAVFCYREVSRGRGHGGNAGPVELGHAARRDTRGKRPAR